MDLIPGGARRNLTANRAAALLAGVAPAGQPAVTRWQLAAELVADVRGLEQRIAAVEARVKAGVAQCSTGLVQLVRVGPVLAEGKSPKEALRCLKRRLSDAVYRCLLTDQHLQSSLIGLRPVRRGESGPRPAVRRKRPASGPARS